MMPTARAGQIRMHYEVHGEGEPLLLIASMGCDLSAWKRQVPDLSRKYRVVVFDNRGSGLTDAPDKPYSIAMMADDTAALMDAIGIDRAHILGQSMGGYIAQELAIRHPERAASLTLAATSIGPYLGETAILEAWAKQATRGMNPKVLFQLLLPFIFTDRTFEDPDNVRMAVETIASRPQGTPTYALIRQFIACAEHSARGRTAHVAAPTLVLASRNDLFVPFSLSEELAAGFPNSRLVVLDGGGHEPNAGSPEKFNRAVLDFLAQVS
jgi:3-oxoadipate enol-lactonase